MTDLIPVPDMQMVWIRLLAPKSPSFTFPAESRKILAPGDEKQQRKHRVMKQQAELSSHSEESKGRGKELDVREPKGLGWGWTQL